MAINETTTNYSLELPHETNIMAADCVRIRNAIIAIDRELKELERQLALTGETADGALQKSGGALTGIVVQLDETSGPFKPGQTISDIIRSALSDYLVSTSEMPNGESANTHYFSRLIQLPAGDIYKSVSVATKNTAGVQLYNVLNQGWDKNFKKFLKSDFITDGSDDYQLAQVGYLNANHRRMYSGGLSIYAGGANASDTADLHHGRGLTADKPFATLDAAIAFVESRYDVYGQVTYILQSDQTVNGRWIFSPHMWVSIHSDETDVRRTLTLGKTFDIYCVPGCVSFSNIDFVAASDRTGLINLMGYYHPVRADFYACTFTGRSGFGSPLNVQGPNAHAVIRGATTINGPSNYGIYTGFGSTVVTVDNPTVTLNGAFAAGATVAATGGASVMMNCTWAGNATGKRYIVSYGGKLLVFGKGENAIPGNAAGTVETGGMYY